MLLASVTVRSYASECESCQENLAAGLPSLEPLLQVKHATLTTKLEKEVGDDPEYACCCCEHLLHKKMSQA